MVMADFHPNAREIGSGAGFLGEAFILASEGVGEGSGGLRGPPSDDLSRSDGRFFFANMAEMANEPRRTGACCGSIVEVEVAMLLTLPLSLPGLGTTKLAWSLADASEFGDCPDPPCVCPVGAWLPDISDELRESDRCRESTDSRRCIPPAACALSVLLDGSGKGNESVSFGVTGPCEDTE